LQGYWKLLEGGAATGHSISGCTAADFSETAKQLRNHTKHKKLHKIFSHREGSGSNLSPVCSWLLPPDKAIM